MLKQIQLSVSSIRDSYLLHWKEKAHHRQSPTFFDGARLGGMAPHPAGAASAYAINQPHSEGKGEADTTSSCRAMSSDGCVQIPTQPTTMPNKSDSKNQSISRTQVHGRKHKCLVQWKAPTQDPWIHQVVEGYQIEFSSVPPIGTLCQTYEMDKTRLEALDQEILDLLNEGAVENIKSGKLSFASPMFAVPNKGGKWRPLINL